MRSFRSLLYAPGNQPKLMEEAATYGADALIFDLEDRVPADQKAEARLATRECIEKLKQDQVIYVRVNGPETGLLRDDLEAVWSAASRDRHTEGGLAGDGEGGGRPAGRGGKGPWAATRRHPAQPRAGVGPATGARSASTRAR